MKLSKYMLLAGVVLSSIFSTNELKADWGSSCCDPCCDPCEPIDFSGFYVGVNAGAFLHSTKLNLEPAGAFLDDLDVINDLRRESVHFKRKAFTGGLQVGYNSQIPCSSIVWGVETDFNWVGANLKHHGHRPLPAPIAGFFDHDLGHRVHWFGTLRPRIGFVWENLLLYVTGGLAYGKTRTHSHVHFTLRDDRYEGNLNKIRVGWTAGAGAEYKFNCNYSVKVEYLYIDLGKHRFESTATSPLFDAFSYATHIRHNSQAIRFGLNYSI